MSFVAPLPGTFGMPISTSGQPRSFGFGKTLSLKNGHQSAPMSLLQSHSSSNLTPMAFGKTISVTSSSGKKSNLLTVSTSQDTLQSSASRMNISRSVSQMSPGNDRAPQTIVSTYRPMQNNSARSGRRPSDGSNEGDMMNNEVYARLDELSAALGDLEDNLDGDGMFEIDEQIEAFENKLEEQIVPLEESVDQAVDQLDEVLEAHMQVVVDRLESLEVSMDHDDTAVQQGCGKFQATLQNNTELENLLQQLSTLVGVPPQKNDEFEACVSSLLQPALVTAEAA